MMEAIDDVNHPYRVILEKYELHLIPLVNPDGYAFTYAEDGVGTSGCADYMRRRILNHCILF